MMYKKWVRGKLTSENVRQKQVAKQKAKQCFLFACAFSIGIVSEVLKARQESIGKEPGQDLSETRLFFTFTT